MPTTEHTTPAPVSAASSGPARTLTPVVLRTSRLTLRPWRESDIEAMTEACQDEEIQRFTMLPTPYGRADADAFIRTVCPAGWAAGTDATFGAFEAESGALVGSVGLLGITQMGEPFGGSAGIGYWTAVTGRRRGLTTEAVAEVCRWGFGELGLARIEWHALVGNDGSWAVARNSGFTREGMLRARMVHRGERKDIWIGSLLADDVARARAGGGAGGGAGTA